MSFKFFISCKESPITLAWSASEAGVTGGGGDFNPSLEPLRLLRGEDLRPVLAVSERWSFFLRPSLKGETDSSFFESVLEKQVLNKL